MRVRLLGTVDAVVDGQTRRVPGLRRRALLAALALRRGSILERDLLVRVVWDRDAPASAANTLQSHVSYLRRLFGDRRAVRFREPGYLFAGDQSDAEQAEQLIGLAGRAGDLTERRRQLLAALDLWRGQPLADVASLPWFEPHVVRLERLRLRATHELIQTRLALGEHASLLPELEQLAQEHPLDERIHEAEMLALYRAGRQAEALATYRRIRDNLNDHLGIDPGPALQRLQVAILRQEPGPHRPAEAQTGPIPPVPIPLAPNPPVPISPVPNPPVPIPPAPNPPVPPEQKQAVPNQAVPPVPVQAQPRSQQPPAQLPAPIRSFVGRQAEVSKLDGLLVPGPGDHPGVVVIASVAGTAGVGKTTLAVWWAHRVRSRFPDGQLFVDLRGFAAGPPVRPIDALAGFLRALGIPPEQVPTQVGEAAALYRTHVSGRRMLIVLDNAGDADQVRALLPGDPGCLVLVTSRDRLAGLVARDDARPVPLDVLTENEALDLLTRILGEARVAAEREAAADLARVCAFLPLALRIAAATLSWQPDRSLAEYVKRLGDDAIGMLTIDGDQNSGVRAAFDASYEALPAPARRLFRLLSLAPGVDTGASAAAALGDIAEPQAGAALERLAGVHLLDRHPGGRYTCHDLLRAYAAERSAREDGGEELGAALRRLYDWYLSTVDGAANLLYPHMLRLPRTSDRPIRSFPDQAAALDWLDTERHNLVAAVRRAATGAGGELAGTGCLIADALRGYFHLGRYSSAWLAVADSALDMAAALGDVRSQAAARHSLGTAYRCRANLPEATRHYVEALRLARRAGWPEAEATALANLGIVRHGQGRLKAAVVQLTRALALDRQAGRRAGVTNNLINLAAVYLDQGRLTEAAAYFTEALELTRTAGNRHGQALALTGLGEVHREQGRHDDAVRTLTEAMGHCDEIGDRDGLATVQVRLGAVERDRGRMAAARDHALAALATARDAGDPRTEAGALTVLASTTDDPAEAYRRYARALDLAASTTVPRLQVEAVIGLAGAALRLGRTHEARRLAAGAVHRAAASGYRVLEAEAGALSARIGPAGADPAPERPSEAITR